MIQKLQNNKGFVILFAVTLGAILLSIALGVANIAYKEIRFGTSAKDTNDAFFAADTGAECALFYDSSIQANNAFTGTASMNCAGSLISISGPSPIWNFVVPGLGPTGTTCAKVKVDKTVSLTKVVSTGYNTGSNGTLCSPGASSVERQIELNY